MTSDTRLSLLKKYFRLGWLSRNYYDGKQYCCPYSPEDRLLAGEKFYADFITWCSGTKLTTDYSRLKVQGGKISDNLSLAPESERFRKALRLISRQNLPVLYKIVLEENEIKAPGKMSARERLYFNDEIKGLLCRGLDELCTFYRRI